MEARFAAAACDRRGGGRRRCGDSPAPAAQRPDRARRRSTLKQYFTAFSARPRGGLPQRPAAARRWPGWRSDGHARRCSRGARRGACSTRLERAAAAGRRRRGRGISLAARGHGTAARRLDAHQRARRRRAVHPGLAGLGSATWPSRRGHRRRDRGDRRRCVALALVRRFPRHWWAPGRRASWSRSAS